MSTNKSMVFSLSNFDSMLETYREMINNDKEITELFYQVSLASTDFYHTILSSMIISSTIFLGWFTLILIGTIYPKGALGNLSIRRSLAELTSERRSRLDVLDVFRVVAIVWVMVNHTGSEGRIDVLDRLPSGTAFKKNIHDHPIFGALLGNSALGVEIFLVLSGLLAARSWLRHADTPFLSHYAKFISRRILRLGPSVLVFMFLAQGPFVTHFLPRFHASMLSTCGRDGFISHLTFTSNWQSTPTCMGYLWYLGLDMQLYVFAPLLLQILHTRPRVGIITFTTIILLSCVARAVYCTTYGVCNKSDVDIPFISFPNQTPEMLKEIYAGLWEMYGRPHTKCGPYLLGLLTGYYSILHDQTIISTRTSRCIYYLSLAVALSTIYGILPQYWWPEIGSSVYNVVYTAIFGTVFAAAIIGMVVGSIYTRHGVNTHPAWAVMGRLTYNSYLLHMPIIYIFNFSSFLQTAEGAFGLICVVPFVFICSFTAALIFYIAFESPIGTISRNWAIKIGL